MVHQFYRAGIWEEQHTVTIRRRWNWCYDHPSECIPRNLRVPGKNYELEMLGSALIYYINWALVDRPQYRMTRMGNAPTVNVSEGAD